MSAQQTSVRLYIPGLAADFSGIASDAFPAMPLLSKILSRSDRIAFDASSHEDTLFRMFGLTDYSLGVSAASLRYLGDTGKRTDQYCVCIDPVYLRTETSGLTLIAGSQLSITNRESKAFQEAISALFAEDGWTLCEGDSKHWYLFTENPETIKSSPISTVIGKSVSNYLPTGENGKTWQSRLNEVQMLLHATPENEQRIFRKQLPINSVWLWGGGELPKEAGMGYTRAYTNDPLTKGLAVWTKTQVSDLPKRIEECLSGLAKGESVYIQIENLLEASLYSDFIQWSDKLAALEAQWLNPLWSALRSGKIGLVEIIVGNQHLYRLKRSQMLRFWRKELNYQTLQK